MLAHLPSLNAILKRHKIDQVFRPEFRRLVEEGRRPSRRFRDRLNRVASYKLALDDILAELSKSLDHKFPPVDYQPQVHYESLNREDVMLLTSDG